MKLRLPDLCLGVSTVLSVILLSLFITKRGAHIPLSYRTMFDGWGRVKSLFLDARAPLTFSDLDSVTWCPDGEHSSSQCACFRDYFETRYLPDVYGTPDVYGAPDIYAIPAINVTHTSAEYIQIGQNHSDGILKACLKQRPSWRKDSCGNFCSVHLAIPILLSNLYMCILFSTVASYRTYPNNLNNLINLIPLLLSLATIGLNLGLDHEGGVVSSLSILSVIADLIFLGPTKPWDSQVFWSYHRFLCSALAVWAGVTHQARDIYLVAAYGILGFFAGFMSYAVFLVKLGVPCRHSGSVCLYLYMGIGGVAASFLILIQQHWLSGRGMWSTFVSTPLLGVALLQCLGQTPYHAPPLELNILISLSLLVGASVAVIADLYSY